MKVDIETDNSKTLVNALARISELEAAREQLLAQEAVLWVLEIDGIIKPELPIGMGSSLAGKHKVVAVPLYAQAIPAQQAIEPVEKMLTDMCDQQKNAWLSVCKLLDEVRPEWLHFGKSGLNCALDAIREMAVQPSQAVAVPDTFKCWWAMCEAEAEMAGDRITDDSPVLAFVGSGSSCHVTAGDIRKMVSIPAQSPRITEQDARENCKNEPVYLFRRKGLEPFLTCSRERFDELSALDCFETKVLYELSSSEPSDLVRQLSTTYPHPRISEDELMMIAKKYYDWCNSEVVFNRRTMLEAWVNDEGRALLNKLNAKPEQEQPK